MKKFLTVLLVIAVMFTFSFGSAFADGVTGYDKNLATRYFEIAMDKAEEAGSVEVTQDGSKYVVDYATLNAHRADLLEAVLAYDKDVATDYVQDVDGLKTVLGYVESGKLAYDVTMAVVAAQFKADKESALAILNNLDVSEYSEKDMDKADDDGCKTYKEHVQYLVNQAVKAINDADDFNSDSVVKDYADAKVIIDGYFCEYENTPAGNTVLVEEEGYEGAEGAKIGLGVYKINNAYSTNGDTLEHYTTDYVNAQGAVSDAGVAAVKAKIASNYAAYLATPGADKTFAANMKKVLDFLAEEEVEGVADVTFDISKKDAVAKAITDVEKFEAEAAQLAAETDAKGALVRDAKDVADLVTKGTVNAYGTAAGLTINATDYPAIGSALSSIRALYASLDSEKLAYAKKIRETFIANFLSDAEEDETYYSTEMTKVKALTEEYLAKVNAVTDIEKVDSYDVDYLGAKLNVVGDTLNSGKIADVKKASDINGLAGVSSLVDTAKKYLDLMNDSISKSADKYDTSGNYARLTKEIQKLVGNSQARTAKEIAALSDQAVALIKTLPTTSEVEAAKEAADDAVKAIPTTVTTADKATIEAAKTAVDAYEDLSAQDYTRTTLDAAIKKLAYAYNNEVTTASKSLTTTDKAAVKALKDEIKAFTDVYKNESIFETLVAKLDGYLADIQKTEATAVTKAVSAIPVSANLTEASREKVKAARELYDAYVAEYTDYEDYDYDYNTAVTTDGFVADDFDYATLVKAETLLGITATEKADENAKAYVQDLKIVARSVKTSKGNIKVTIKADVKPLLDAGYTVEYKFYRSTKARSKYSAKLTKTTNTYTNTTGTKGVKYYYKAKLIVKNADGKILATTPLTQCKYACRVK